MIVTREVVAEKLLDYLNRNMTLAQLVDWAENVMLEEELADRDVEVLRKIVPRLGLADVRDFGLSWDDCYEFLSQLGYAVRVQAEIASDAT